MDKSSNKTNSISITAIIAFCCILSLPLLDGVLPSTVRYVLCIVGLVYPCGRLIASCNSSRRVAGLTVGWIAVAVIIVLSCITMHQEFTMAVMYLCLMVIVIVLCSYDTSWWISAYVALIIMLGIHLVATLVFYFIPSMYYIFASFAKYKSTFGEGYQLGLTSHYSKNGFYLASGAVLSSGVMFMAREKKSKDFIFILTCLFFFGVLLTQKRTVLVISAACVLAMWTLRSRRNKFVRTICATALLLAVAVLLASSVPAIGQSLSRLFETFDGSSLDETTSGRVELWNVAVDGWKQNIWFGNGWGSYRYYWPGGTVTIYAHNEALGLLHALGLIGAIPVVCVMVWTLWRTAALWRLSRRRSRSDVASALWCSLWYQLFALTYAFTTGVLLETEQFFWGYLICVGVALSANQAAIDGLLIPGEDGKGLGLKNQRRVTSARRVM